MINQQTSAIEPIILFDTTLRDGEQAPGNTMFDWEKEEIADALTRAGVDVIEAGFPAASLGDYESVRYVSESLAKKYGTTMPVIAGLAMAKKENVIRAGEAIVSAIGQGRGRIHTFIASSEIHADRKLRKTQEEILDMARQAVRLARTYTDNVEFSPEDASRTGIDFLVEISAMAAREGARTINIPDTVGYAVPEEYGKMISRIVESVKPYGSIVSTHCHNDLGRAVDNSLTALLNGAKQVECTINGIGERAGNASLEQIVMNLIVRKDYYGSRGLATKFNPEMIGELSRLVAMATGSWPAPNTPIVGDNAFAHQAGIHQDGMSKSDKTYEIMTPESVGWVGERYIIGKHSGKSGVIEYLKVIGYNPEGADIESMRTDVKAIADRQKHVFDDDMRRIAHKYGLKPRKEVIEFDANETAYTRLVSPAVKMNMSWNDVETTVKGTGNGPIHAAYEAIKKYTGNGIDLVSFKIGAIGGGEKAMAGARVTIRKNGKYYVARGGHSDTVVAAISAYVNAINRAIVDV